MADLTPTWDAPGIHVSEPSPHTAATADYVCRCGEYGTAKGDSNVKALVEDYTANHGPAHRNRGARR
ncbi:hypothetical protein [Streptomyces sp. NPDC001876]|uniref:hypothetical protein n=1 Tax=Streptomyces sp. NPDC001876 TaxID=3154402 RepID=UPI00331F67FC